jgi:DNA-binding transcriptional ArsR family regulator
VTTPFRDLRTLDIESLKGLAHPLRAQLLESLSAVGPATASQLGERLGESSGSTSYHLRILEKHGFVREDATRGSARERYWERTPTGINLNVTDFAPNSAERAAAETVEREWDRSRSALLEEFNRRGATELSKEWYDATASNTINMQLTPAQLAEFVREVEVVFERWVSTHKQATPGSRPIQSHFNAFPVMGGHVSGAE